MQVGLNLWRETKKDRILLRPKVTQDVDIQPREGKGENPMCHQEQIAASVGDSVVGRRVFIDILKPLVFFFIGYYREYGS